MICPQCLKTIDDDVTFCPYCHGYVGSGEHHSDFVFCEGCGARLSSHDRTCPKCGRPAPGILSTDSSSSDLAAGKTASFPRLTKQALQTETPFVRATSAAEVVDNAVDPASTNVLSLDEVEQRGEGAPAVGDPYHVPRRSYRGVVIALLAVALVGGGAWFVTSDPLGVMPGLYTWFKQAASEEFPSREGTVPVRPEDDASEPEPEEPSDAPLTDDEVFARLDTAYDQVVAYGSEESFGEVIDAFNTSYLAPKHSDREAASASAYSLRDAVQGTIDDLDAMKLPDDSKYREDVANVRQLATWMFGRVDQICRSWDVSLSFEDGESLTAHQDEILQPMREAGSSDLENYDAHVTEYKPQPK